MGGVAETWGRHVTLPSILTALVAVLVLLCGAPGAAAAETGSISGTVSNASDSPINSQDICVAAVAEGNHTAVGTAQTDGAGDYTIANLPIGSYSITFEDCPSSSRNDAAQTYGQSSSPGGTAVLVTAHNTTSGIDAELQNGASISGHVYAGSGDSTALEGVCVEVSSTGSEDLGADGEATTAADGSYTVERVDPGLAYTVEFDPSCGSTDSSTYAPGYYANDSQNSYSATPVTPTLNAPASGIDGHLASGSSIGGTVTDANGDAITSKDICVTAQEESGAGFSSAPVTSNASGGYEVAGLPAGQYIISAADCAGSSRDDQVASTAERTVGPGQALTGDNLQLPAGTSISGHVYGGSGTTTPLDGACVDADVDDGGSDSTVTASDGSYSVEGLDPGETYTVYFDPSCASNGDGYAPEYYDGASDYSSATSVTPTVAAPESGIDAQLSTGASISGQITDSDGNAITTEDICVTADEEDGDNVSSATTDASGDYTISGLPAGTYDVSATDCAGSARNDVPGEPSSQPTLTADQAVIGVNIQLAAGTSISGHVYGGSGSSTPVELACVEADGAGSAGQAETAASGSYTISHLLPGVSYEIYVDPTCSGSSPYIPGSLTPVTPTVSQPATGVDAHLTLGGSISGQVSDSNGDVITSADVCVSANENEGGDAFYQAVSNASGDYTVSGLSPGVYDVSASDCYGSSRNDAPTGYGDVTAYATAATTGINIQLAAGTSISGYVYGGNGTSTPLDGACVYASSDAFEAGGSTATAADGSYTISNLDPNVHYTVYFDPSCAANGAQYAPENYTGVVTPTVDDPATGIDANVQIGGSISGQITDAKGQPITSQDICIDVNEESGDYFGAYATTDGSGDYSVDGLPSGTYDVQASDCDSTRNDVPGEVDSVAVAASQAVTGVDIQLEARATISGQITDAHGNPITSEDICVNVESTDDDYDYSATTNNSGDYTIDGIMPDTYDVSASDCYSSTRNDVPGDYGDLVLSANENATAIDIQLAAATTISGTVYGGAGDSTPLNGACIDASGADGSSDYASTAADGTYTLSNVEPGVAYTLEFDPSCASNGGAYVYEYYDGVADQSSATPVTATLDAPATGIDGHAPLGASISGQVTDANNDPITSQDVCVTAESDDGNYAYSVTTDSSGDYTIEGITPDTYDVSAADCPDSTRDDVAFDYGDVVVGVGQAQTGIDLQLAAGTSISGHVYGGSGTSAPLNNACVEAWANDGTGGDTSTAPDGSYTIGNLEPGVGYTVEFDPSCATNGGDWTAGYYDGTSDEASATPVTGTVASPAVGIDGHLAPAASISGQITDANGDPITTRDICVSAYSPTTDDSSSSATTNAAGDYTLTGLPAGTYDVTAEDCYGSARDDVLGTYGDVPVATSQVVTGVNIELAAGSSISGEITDADGNPITTDDICFSIDLVSGYVNYSEQTTFDGAGGYTITNLPAGTYDVTASDCGYGTRDDAPATDDDIVTAAGSPTTGIDFQLPAGTSISGHVYGGSGTTNPLSDACVDVFDANSGDDPPVVSEMNTADDGSYEISHLAPRADGYVVEFLPCDAGSSYTSEYYDNEQSLGTADVIDPTAADPSTGVDGHLSSGASISGTVEDSNGDPITTGDICVTAWPSGGGQGFSGTSDASGNYTITGLPADSYYVNFADCGGSSRNDVEQWYGGSLTEASSTLVVLSYEGAQDGVDAEMQPAASISGTVYGGTGTTTPLSEVCVEVDSKSADDQYYNARTDSSGDYTIEHVAPLAGGYTVDFQDCNTPANYVSQYYGGNYSFDSASVITPTAAVPSTGIDANLVLGGSIEGTVTDPNDDPITSGVCATAYSNNATDGYYSAYSYGGELSDSGQYSIGGLPSGSYTVEFDDCGGRNDVPQTLPGLTPVTIGSPTTGVNVTMQPATAISGHVYGGAGTANPLYDECVEAIDTTGDNTEYGNTLSDGSYTVDHISPTDSYVVYFYNCYSDTGNAAYASQYYDGVSVEADAVKLTPTLADPATGIDGHLQSGAPVTTITGGPANNASTSATTATFAFTANASGATFDCSLDGGSYQPCTSPYTTGTLGSGSHTFTVEASANGLTESLPPSVSWTVAPSSPNSTAQGTVTAGEQFSSDVGGDTSSSTPVITEVTLPAAGELTVTNEPATTQSGNGYTVLGQQVDISATDPDGTGEITGTVDDPIELTFLIDSSEIPPGTNIDSLTVERNGTAAAACTGAPGTADPDPCVESVTQLAGGDVEIDVLTTHCSIWNLAEPDTGQPTTSTPIPLISGTLDVNSQLSTTNGTFGGSGIGYTYQWYRGTSPINDATNSDYTLTPDDVGQAITVTVTATNNDGSASETSLPVDIPAAPSTDTPIPLIGGTLDLNSQLSTTNGTFDGTGIGYTYQWYRGTSPINDATNAQYTLTQDDAGQAITVTVTATNGSGSASETSLPVEVPPAPSTGTPIPLISGTLDVNSQLSTTNGTFGGSGIGYTYQWYRGTSPINDATNAQYTLTQDDAGLAITVTVTATNNNGSASETSLPVEVPPAPSTATPIPLISGTLDVNSQLSTTNGTFGGSGIGYTYQWYRGTSPINDATNAQYTLTSADLGQAISVTVTATNGSGSASEASLPVDVPAAGGSGGSGSGGSGGSSGSGSPPSTSSPAVLELSLASVLAPTIPKLRKDGLAVSPDCTLSCAVTVELTVSGSEAKALKLVKHPKATVIAAGQATLSPGAAQKVVIRLTPAASKALAHAKSLSATLTVSAGTAASPVTQSVEFRK